MPKRLQILLLAMVLAIGIGARSLAIGWLIPIFGATVLVFGFTHLFLHLSYLAFFQTSSPRKWWLWFLSHGFFLSIFILQMDFDDSQAYSPLGIIFGIEDSWLIEWGYHLSGLAILGYIIIQIILYLENKKMGRQASESTFIVPTLILTIIFLLVFIQGTKGIHSRQERRALEQEGTYQSVRRALQQPELVLHLKRKESLFKSRKLPMEIGQLTKVQTIQWTNQNLRTIPDEIGQLKQLEELNVLDNNIQKIPDAICQCTSLRILRVGGELTSLPNCLKDMRSLRHLSIQRNAANELLDE